MEFTTPNSKPSRKVSSPAEVENEVASPAEVETSDSVKEEKPKYDSKELLEIFDEILFSGEYTEQITIKGRLKVWFRTRSAGEIEQIGRIVDGTTATLVSTLEHRRSLLNLQYALAQYQDKVLSPLKTEERAKFIQSIPGPIIALLLKSLYEFDVKVQAACEEADENF